MIELRTVNLTRYITPLREGGSLPALAEADDEFKYVVKFRGAGHGTKALISELIGGEVAHILGFRVPELVFLNLDEAFGRTEGDEEIQDLLQGSRGLNLGLHFLSGALTFDPVATKVDPELASRIVWLDAYLTNIDRTFRNTNMLMWHKELWLIDHGASLYFHHSWENWEKHAVSPFTYIKNHVLLPEASRLEEADTLLRPMLTDEKIQQIVALIPDDWLHWEDTHETPEEIRDIYTRVELQNAGFEVVIIDNLSNSSADVVDNIEKVSGIRPAFEKLDCLDFAGLDAVFTKYKGIKAIIHFAASKAVGESVQKPLLYYRNNLVSLINLLELMPKHGVEGIVFSSSCTVYGQPDELPVTEKAPIKKAESPYGNTKQINEEIVRDTVASGAPINAILLRYFNPIGAHPTALLGELPNGVPQNLIPYLTQTAIGIREKLSVFGDDYDTPDGSCIRDFINVVDLAKAHVIAIRRILENKQKEKVEVFNIGTGRGLSVLELINAFEKATGVKLNYQIVGRRAGDIEKVWADPKFANEELGWTAVETIEDTLLSAWNWQLKLRERGIQ